MNMSNSSNLSEYCAIAEAVLGARGFSHLLILEILVGTLAALANSPLMVLVWRVSVFHYNLRLLLSQLSFGLSWYSVGYVVKAVNLLNHIVRNTDPCSFAMNAYLCKCIEIPFTIPISMTVFNLLAVNLERLYSTLLYRRYDVDSTTPWLGSLLAVSGWVFAVSTVVGAAAGIRTQNRMVGICENLLSMTAEAATKTFVLSCSVLTAGVISCVAGYLWNKYKLKQAVINRAQHTLVSRFQIDQNIKVNRVLMPSMFIMTLCYLPNYAFLSIVIAGSHLSYEVQTWLIHVNYLWKLIYALAHALISFKRNRYLWQRMSKVGPVWVSGSVGRVRNDAVNEAEVHFKILEQVWRYNRKKVGGHEARNTAQKVSRPPSVPKVRRVEKVPKDKEVTGGSVTSKF